MNPSSSFEIDTPEIKSVKPKQDDLKSFQKKEKSFENKLCTAVEHAAIKISEEINKHKLKQILISGGGAYHQFLIERIAHFTTGQLIIPNKKTIEFKEALVFAFLGVLRMREKTNCLKSVTGALFDNCGGAIYSGK